MDIVTQLPQLEALCERLYQAQVRQQRACGLMVLGGQGPCRYQPPQFTVNAAEPAGESSSGADAWRIWAVYGVHSAPEGKLHTRIPA